MSSLGRMGRFGNQLFQYAAIKSYSVKNCIPIILPPSKEHRLGELNLSFESRPITWLRIACDYKYIETQFNYNLHFFIARTVPH